MNCFCKIDIGKSGDWGIYRATTWKWRQIRKQFLYLRKVELVVIEIITAKVSVTFETTGESVICFCKIDIWKSRCWRIYRATTRKWHRIWMWFEGSVKVFGVQIEILASVFDWISKQKLNLLLFLWDSYRRKLGLMDLPGHDGKVTSDINFILSPYYRSFRADRDVLC